MYGNNEMGLWEAAEPSPDIGSVRADMGWLDGDSVGKGGREGDMVWR